MMRTIVFLLLMFLPVAGTAQTGGFNTSSGLVQVILGQDQPFLDVGGRPVELPHWAYYATLEAQFGDWILIGMSPGGRICSGDHVWFLAKPGEMRFSTPFGDCQSLLSLGIRGEEFVATLDGGAPGKDPIAYVFDGRSIREEPGQRGMSGWTAGGGPEFWLGRHPYEFLTSGDTRARLAQFMEPEALAAADGIFNKSSGFEMDGDWVVATASSSDFSAHGVIALGRDGMVLVAMKPWGKPVSVHGALSGILPAAIVDLMKEK
ncbi:MAG: hypothetical protein KDK53_15620 [Maritimibacter sp.]|nr:hypothetical protein [Maritimibacter sp.]